MSRSRGCSGPTRHERARAGRRHPRTARRAAPAVERGARRGDRHGAEPARCLDPAAVPGPRAMSARELVADTRALLAARLRLSSEELDEVIGMVLSRLDVSIPRLFRAHAQ